MRIIRVKRAEYNVFPEEIKCAAGQRLLYEIHPPEGSLCAIVIRSLR